MVEPLNRPEAGVEAVREFFRVTIRAMTEESPRSGCLIANTITELASDDPAALLRCNRSREQLERAFRRALEQARARGELPSRVNVDAVATLLVSHNYGLKAMVKTGASADELEAATEALLAVLA
jgi:TetR/AcrR family transcriptional repressor of nem operon